MNSHSNFYFFQNWSGVYCNETSDLGLDKPMSRNALTFPLKPNLPQPRLIKRTNLDLDALVASILAQSSKAEIAKPSSAAKPVIAEPSTTSPTTTSPTTTSPTTTTALPTTEKAPSTSTMLVTSDSEEDEYSEESEESDDSADTPNALGDLPADLQGDGQGGLGGFRRRPRRRRKRVKGKSKAKSKGKKGKFRNPAQVLIKYLLTLLFQDFKLELIKNIMITFAWIRNTEKVHHFLHFCFKINI